VLVSLGSILRVAEVTLQWQASSVGRLTAFAADSGAVERDAALAALVSTARSYGIRCS
jgi:hypothetical protein